jgi:hypothetical protein
MSSAEQFVCFVVHDSGGEEMHLLSVFLHEDLYDDHREWLEEFQKPSWQLKGDDVVGIDDCSPMLIEYD